MDHSLQAPGTALAARTPPPAPFFGAPVGNPRLRAVKEPDETRSKGRERQGTTACLWPTPGPLEPSTLLAALLELVTRPTTGRGGTHVDPGMVHELCDGQPLGGVRLQQEADQLLG